MRKITLLLVLIWVNHIFGGVKTSTAWFNNQDFSGYTAGTTDMSGTFGITKGNSAYLVFVQPATANLYGSAIGNVLGLSRSNVSPFTENGNASNWTKTFATAYSGRYFYVKTSFYHCTGATYYTLRNTEGNTIFQFGGDNPGNSTSAAVMTTGNARATIGLGKRSSWSDIEFIIDLVSKKVVKCKLDNSYQTLKTYSFSNLDLTYSGTSDIKSIYINTLSFTGAGFDNTTIGELEPDNIKDITSSQTTHQTNDSQTPVSTTLGVTNFTTMMSTDLPFSGSNLLDIVWSVSNWGGLSVSDQGKLTLVRGASDYTSATLSTTGAISADATITVSAVFGATTLTKQITLKAASIEGVKSTLLSEIGTATTLNGTVANSNPYLTDIKSTLTAAIATAQSVYDNSVSAIEVADATTTLQTAEATFSAGLSTYTTFTGHIAAVTNTKNAEIRTAPFFTAIKATLQSAIDAATTATGTVSSAGDISAAQSTLLDAQTLFNAEKPAYENLNTQISSVITRLAAVDSRKGDSQFHRFTTSAFNTLTTAKSTAETSRDNAETALELNTSKTTLENALAAFEATHRVNVGTSFYRIYSYGVNDGDGGSTKHILFASGSNLKYKVNSSSMDVASIWQIEEITNEVYTIKNVSTGEYLAGNTLSVTPTNFTFNDNQGGQVNTPISDTKDGFILLNIKNSSNRYLEIDTWDAVAGTGSMTTSTSTATRYRFCYQFEPMPTLIGNGNLSNSSNWSSGSAPSSGSDIVLASGELAVDLDINLSNISVANGSTLTVNPGKKITVANSFTNNGTFILQSDNSGTATFIDENANGNTVTATVNQYLPNNRNWYVGVPVTDAATVPFSALTASGASSVAYWDESIGSWVGNYTGNLSRGRGYIAVSNSGSNLSNISFTGVLNTGNVNVEVTRTVGVNKAGFNLISNPYPSYLNPCALITSSAKLEPTIWYRTKGSAYTFETVNTASGEGTNGVTGYIPPMQAFWVRVVPNADNPANNNSEILTFTNAMRYHANPTIEGTPVTTTLMKARKQSTKTLIRLVVSNGIHSDETLIYTNENALNGMDKFDSRKISNDNSAVPEIYTLIDAENIVINGMNVLPLNKEIALGFKTGQMNTFSIKLSQIENLAEGVRVVLKDEQTGILTDLTDMQAYSFESAAVSSSNRFSIVFKSPSSTTEIVNSKDDEGFNVLSESMGKIVLQRVPVGAIIRLYDMLGKQWLKTYATDTTMEVYTNVVPGIYTISINNELKKVIIK